MSFEKPELKNPLEEKPTEGFFKDFNREQLADIRNTITEDSRLSEYYKLTKNRLIKESGLQIIHRGNILNEMYKTLLSGGDIENSLARKLESIAAAVRN